MQRPDGREGHTALADDRNPRCPPGSQKTWFAEAGDDHCVSTVGLGAHDSIDDGYRRFPSVLRRFDGLELGIDEGE